MGLDMCENICSAEVREDTNCYPRHACGVFGIYGHPDSARLTYLGLYALQHRGEESAGIVSTDGKMLYVHKDMGLVGEVFSDTELKQLPGHAAIGHVRYSTTGSSILRNAQPLIVDYSRGPIAIAHNGNLINASVLRDELEAYGSIFQTTVDSEIVIHLMAKPTYRTRHESLIGALERIKGAYSLVLLTEDEMIGVRDPYGFRPLCVGRLGDAFVLSSETCALDLIQADYVRDVEPGEAVFIDKHGMRSVKFSAGVKSRYAFCIFEHIYFARPDSKVFGESVHVIRQSLGRRLAREHPVEADVVIPIPDSGNSAALGYSHQSGIVFETGFIRNHYVGRTFIQPSQFVRDLGVKIKLNPVKDILQGKRAVVVDDSIVRGTTCRTRVDTLRAAGAKEIHMRISCPPHKFPCFYGIDFPTRQELIAHSHTMEEIKKYLNVDSIGYLSVEGLLACVSMPREYYCTACFTGEYPIDFGEAGDKYCIERKRTALVRDS
jgi:amidophosphoribosyltransferase